MLLTTGSGTLFEKLNEITKAIDDTKTSTDLRLNEKMSRKINEMEESLKKTANRDYKKIESELLNMRND